VSSPTSGGAHCNSQQLDDYFHCVMLEYGNPLCNYVLLLAFFFFFWESSGCFLEVANSYLWISLMEGNK